MVHSKENFSIVSINLILFPEMKNEYNRREHFNINKSGATGRSLKIKLFSASSIYEMRT